MAGITQKGCVALFPLWSLRKTFWEGRANVNQHKQTKNLEFLQEVMSV